LSRQSLRLFRPQRSSFSECTSDLMPPSRSVGSALLPSRQTRGRDGHGCTGECADRDGRLVHVRILRGPVANTGYPCRWKECTSTIAGLRRSRRERRPSRALQADRPARDLPAVSASPASDGTDGCEY
jgi:hypothetical protein